MFMQDRLIRTRLFLGLYTIKHITNHWDRYYQYADIITKCNNLSEEFIEEHEHDLPWDLITEYQDLSNEFISKHRYQVDWEYLLQNNRYHPNFLNDNWNVLINHMETISKTPYLSETFIEQHEHELPWDILTQHQNFSTMFIYQHRHQVDWEYLLQNNQYLPEFLVQNWDILHHHIQTIKQTQKLTWKTKIDLHIPLTGDEDDLIKAPEEEILEHRRYTKINQLANHRRFSTEFLLETIPHELFLATAIATQWRDLPEEILDQYAHRLSQEQWWFISHHRKFSVDFMQKYAHLMDYADNYVTMSDLERHERLKYVQDEDKLDVMEILTVNQLNGCMTMEQAQKIVEDARMVSSRDNKPDYMPHFDWLGDQIRIWVTHDEVERACKVDYVTFNVKYKTYYPVRGQMAPKNGRPIRILIEDLIDIDPESGAVYCTHIIG